MNERYEGSGGEEERSRQTHVSGVLSRYNHVGVCDIRRVSDTALVITVVKIYTRRPSDIGDGVRYLCNKVKTTVRDSRRK